MIAAYDRKYAERRDFPTEVRDRLDRLERVWTHRDHIPTEHDRRLFELENRD